MEQAEQSAWEGASQHSWSAVYTGTFSRHQNMFKFFWSVLEIFCLLSLAGSPYFFVQMTQFGIVIPTKERD